ncbi:MAG: DMT family transporter [Lachnospiraceae bacterium]|nr:DMT family transporter [Lachnospiraceae bacterium]
MQKNTTRSSLILFMAALIWGMAFVSQSKGMDYMHPFTFNGVRSLMGAFVLMIYIVVTRKLAGEKAKPIDWKVTLRGGLLCGLALALASTLQQVGIKYTSVGKASFITTLYIIFVPLAGIFLKRKVAGIVWISAVIASFGMYLLCMTESLKLGLGDILVFLCAIAFAAQIILVDHYATHIDGPLLCCMELAVSGVLCGGAALLWGAPSPGQIWQGMGALLYAGVLSSGVAYTFQIIGQKGLNPTVAALLMSLESVVATVSGWVAYKIGFLKTDQTLTPRQIVGCVIVFVAVLLVKLPEELFTMYKYKKNGKN